MGLTFDEAQPPDEDENEQSGCNQADTGCQQVAEYLDVADKNPECGQQGCSVNETGTPFLVSVNSHSQQNGQAVDKSGQTVRQRR